MVCLWQTVIFFNFVKKRDFSSWLKAREGFWEIDLFGHQSQNTKQKRSIMPEIKS